MCLPASKSHPFGCNRLVLTHLGDEMLEERDSLIGIVAEDGMVLEI